MKQVPAFAADKHEGDIFRNLGRNRAERAEALLAIANTVVQKLGHNGIDYINPEHEGVQGATRAFLSGIVEANTGAEIKRVIDGACKRWATGSDVERKPVNDFAGIAQKIGLAICIIAYEKAGLSTDAQGAFANKGAFSVEQLLNMITERPQLKPARPTRYGTPAQRAAALFV